MQKFLFQDVPAEEREELLREQADGVETKEYMNYFEPEELSQRKDLISETVIEIDSLKSEIKLTVAGLKGTLAEKEKKLKNLSQSIRNRGELVTDTVYKMVDSVDKEVGFYSSNGMLIEQRALRPGEGSSLFNTIKGGNEEAKPKRSSRRGTGTEG